VEPLVAITTTMHTSQVTSYRGPDGRSYLSIVTKRRYCFRADTRAEPTTEAAPIHALFEYAAAVDDEVGPLLHEADLIAGLKPATDVLLHGSARSHRGAVPALSAALRVGSTAKAVQVWGDRRISLAPGGRLAFTAPEPFTTLPLTWERAYGGRDIYAESKQPVGPDLGLTATALPSGLGAIAYPRNAHGQGFFIDLDRERLAGAPVPNLDDATDPVRPDRMLVADCLDWIDCPAAACFTPIDVFTFPRALFFLPAEFSPAKRPIHEVTTGIIGRADLARMERFDGTIHPRSFNCAPAGLATNRLYGGERVQLWNLHREREMFEFDLPGERPRLLIEPPGVGTREMEALLQTVVIEPDLDRVTLTWAGAIPVAAVYPDEMTAVMRHGVTWTT
jgi:hypothetical protein